MSNVTPLNFTDSLSIANRALQLLGQRPITAFNDGSLAGAEIGFVYDKLRNAELRRNVWRFSIRKAVMYPINQPVPAQATPTAPQTVSASLPTMLFVPALWSATTEYDYGSIVADALGNIWVSDIDVNVNRIPGVDPVWDNYFGSMNVSPFDPQLATSSVGGAHAYNSGDLVYTTNLDGSINVFKSLIGNNSNNPGTADLWVNTTAYQDGAVVQSADGYFFQSTIDLNQNNIPGFYFPWSGGITYAAGQLASGTDGKVYSSVNNGNLNHNPVGDNGTNWAATGSLIGAYPIWNNGVSYAKNTLVAGIDGFIYISLINANLGNNPLTAPVPPANNPTNGTWIKTGQVNPWTPVYASTTALGEWLHLNATVTDLNITYPVGSGPTTQTINKNVFQLPNGFLREAPQDPKRGSTSFLGAPSGLQYTDWELEGNYLTSQTNFPITYRFGANVTVVSKMDPMFCEMLAARIAEGTCEVLTQSDAKLAAARAHYTLFRNEAIMVNGIETGPTEPPLDDWITCRI